MCVYWLTLHTCDGSIESTGLWRDQLLSLRQPPYAIGEDALCVAYWASAEVNCHLSLGWDSPRNLLDLCIEYKNNQPRTEPRVATHLLAALQHYKVRTISPAAKQDWRNKFIHQEKWTEQERLGGLKYCATDVCPLPELLEKMLPRINIPQALLRGNYMRSVAAIEHAGIPIDVPLLKEICEKILPLRGKIVAEMDVDYRVYDGATFKEARFATYVQLKGWAWPRLPSGALDLKEATFRDMAHTYPDIAGLFELRKTLSKLKSDGSLAVPVARDGRTRYMTIPFGTLTGRHGNKRPDIFMLPRWFRKLIKPRKGYALASIDFSQQEFAIAAHLSQDPKMMEAYESGDAYLAFGIQSGLLPPQATKRTHKKGRDKCKAMILALQYGMTEIGLAPRLNISKTEAKHLISTYKKTYRIFFSWIESVVDKATWSQHISSRLGFGHKVTFSGTKQRTLANFPMQSNGAEILRCSCCAIIDEGIKIIATVHDEIIIEAPISLIEEHTRRARELMTKSGEAICRGMPLRTEAVITKYPDRYCENQESKIWDMISATSAIK